MTNILRIISVIFSHKLDLIKNTGKILTYFIVFLIIDAFQDVRFVSNLSGMIMKDEAIMYLFWKYCFN